MKGHIVAKISNTNLGKYSNNIKSIPGCSSKQNNTGFMQLLSYYINICQCQWPSFNLPESLAPTRQPLPLSLFQATAPAVHTSHSGKHHIFRICQPGNIGPHHTTQITQLVTLQRRGMLKIPPWLTKIGFNKVFVFPHWWIHNLHQFAAEICLFFLEDTDGCNCCWLVLRKINTFPKRYRNSSTFQPKVV